ncbi:hypothetical protein IMCC21906_01551 [Spongiibacter sp. IMCC21906]|uniref:MJ1255/VC2487 family glycosyltransferase n=1 Tax=Spongiibacter sp. IMCC21906 TaxID=1620392 RepID=UPI00062DE85E|nr:MJ1255/VC2487 family glycosyltransferase [Spongiibacter sp. IMCC21906]AKH69229.1 hypothetical protein IMCC21906_01551 [Spongiibacter sp. IMCC21906]
MKILYGVQGTGNGHISRARMMAKHLASRNVDVQFLFSGRAFDKYFDMDVFGDYQLRHGLSFATKNGSISNLHTLLQTKPMQFIKDIRSLDLDDVDVIVTDFEPVTAWAGRLKNKPVVGIGHQYAFGYPDVPQRGLDYKNRLIMRYFAPAKHRIGLHWSHFNAPIVPPIINPEEALLPPVQPPQFVVYLPFEDQQKVTAVLQSIPGYRFIQYSPDLIDRELGNVSQRATSLHGFKKDLCSAQGVICNAGFELISECLHMGMPALAKPVTGQSEQQGNAAALEALGLASVMQEFNRESIHNWLHALPRQHPQHYPDVAAALSDWLLKGQWDNSQSLVEELWHSGGETSSQAAYG